jgi:hypothetical protein
VQLIPAWIDNVQRVMPKGEVVPVPVLCTVTFGAPCNLQPEETKVAFLERARNAVIALKPGGVRMNERFPGASTPLKRSDAQRRSRCCS